MKLVLLKLFFMVTIMLMALYAFAEPIDSYCISQREQMQPQKEPIESVNDVAQSVFTVQGKPFRVIAAPNNRHLLELVGEDGIHHTSVWAGQGDYGGGIESLVLGENGWLWIDGSGIDYVAHIDFNQMPPVIGKPIQIGSLKPGSSDTLDTQFHFSNLMQQPCSYLVWIFGCLPAQGYYSPNLDRVFVSGYPVSLLGSSREVSYEIVEGQPKLLPESLQGATLLHEISINSTSKDQAQRQNGVLFRSLNNDAIFYDGITATSLLKNNLNQTANVTFSKWGVSITSVNKRVIFNIFSEKASMIAELMADLTLREIVFSNGTPSDYLSFFDFPHDPRLFGVARHSVLAEIDGAFRTVATIQEPWIIWGFNDHILDGGFIFTIGKSIKNQTTMKILEYFLIRSSPDVQCLGSLNTNHPFELREE